MNVALRKQMTIDQFLAWEDRQELRYEFDGFQPLAMTGGTAVHSAIQCNLIHALVGRLRDRSCRAHGSELKIRVAERIRYPDAFVVCTPVAGDSKVVSDPVVIFEIVSDSSVTTDLVTKNAEYRATLSVQRYVVLQQAKAAAAIFYRKGEDWLCDPVEGDDAVLRMPEIGIEVPLTEIYHRVEFEAEPELTASG